MLRSHRHGSENDQTQSFGERLEKRAHKLLAKPNRQLREISGSSIIEENIALTLHQIERLHRRKRDINQSLLQFECYVNTEIIQMEERTPRYSPYRFSEREKLQRRLGDIARERRRFMVSDAQELDTLHDKLLSLLTKNKQLEMK